MGYIEYGEDGVGDLVNEGSLESIRSVDGIIFDCDGVLIDARSSYNRTIGKTASFFMDKFAKGSLPEQFVSDDLIIAFRRSGGFNNDWDTTFAVLLFLFSRLPRQMKRNFKEMYESSDYQQSSGSRIFLSIMDKQLGSSLSPDEWLLDDLKRELMDMASKADSTGIQSIEQMIEKQFEGDEEVIRSLRVFKRFLGHPGDVNESILTMAFEEFFYGKDLFREAYGNEPIVYQGEGTVAYEKPIVEEQVLLALRQMFGRTSLGLASGRALISARRTLKKLLDFFNPDGMIFMEDEVRRLGLDRGSLTQFTKPNPYSLLKAANNIVSRGKIIYVGDSAEDFLAVQRANRASSRFLFAGVYGSNSYPEASLKFFLESGVDLVVRSANSLPKILRKIRGVP